MSGPGPDNTTRTETFDQFGAKGIDDGTENFQAHTFQQVSEAIGDALDGDEPFTFYVDTGFGAGLEPVGIFTAIAILEQQNAINPAQRVQLETLAERAMTQASLDQTRKRRITAADIAAQKGAAVLVPLFQPETPYLKILRTIFWNNDDPVKILVGTSEDFESKPILEAIFWERRNGKITTEEAFRLVRAHAGNLKRHKQSIGLFEIIGLRSAGTETKKLLTPAEQAEVLTIVGVGETDLELLEDVPPKDAPPKKIQDVAAAKLPESPGFFIKNRLAVAAAAMAVVTTAILAVTGSNNTASSSQKESNKPAVTTSEPSLDIQPQDHLTGYSSKPAAAQVSKVPEPLITAPQPASQPQPQTATRSPEPTPGTPITLPISTKSGPLGPQFDEAGSVKLWQEAGWEVKIGLRPGGKKSYTLTKKDETARIISPKVTAGQTTVQTE